MKKITVTLMILSVILYALPALAGDCGGCKQARQCRTSTGDGLFQSSSDAIAGCRPKPWLVRPMKPIWPVREEKFLTFQTLADNINGKIPPEPKSDVPAEAKSDVPSGGK
jgi:hypothetical protein